MTAQQQIAFDECMKMGPDFIRRNGATFEIAAKAFQQLASKEKSRLEASRKEDERIKSIAKETRAKQEQDALRQKQIFDVKKRKLDIEKLTAEAVKRKADIDRLAEETDRDLNSLLAEEERMKLTETESMRDEGKRIRIENENKQTTKREQQSIRTAQNSLAKSLKYLFNFFLLKYLTIIIQEL